MGTTVRDNTEERRFEIHVGDELAGFIDYRLADGELSLLHTEVQPRFQDRGLAGQLVQEALDSVRGDGVAVLPYCSYVRRWIAGHPEYIDLVPAAQRSSFDL